MNDDMIELINRYQLVYDQLLELRMKATTFEDQHKVTTFRALAATMGQKVNSAVNALRFE